MLATCLFGRLVGDMHDLLQFSSKDETALAERMEVRALARTAALGRSLCRAELAASAQGVISFLRVNKVPAQLQQRIRAWTGFRLSRDRADAQLQEVPATPPPLLSLCMRAPAWSGGS